MVRLIIDNNLFKKLLNVSYYAKSTMAIKTLKKLNSLLELKIKFQNNTNFKLVT